MQRKIMCLGKSSLVVSLPKEWIDANDLEKGDIISFFIQGNHSMLVYPNAAEKSHGKEISLRIAEDEDEISIVQKILGSFLNGYSEIILTSDKIFTVSQMKAIHNVTGRLYLRVMEADSQCVYIQSVMDESKVSLEQSIQRMHMISRSYV